MRPQSAIHHEVEPTLVPGLNTGGRGARKHLLRHYLAFWPDSLARHSDPGPFESLCPTGRETCAAHPCVGHNHVRHPPRSVVGPKATGGATAGSAICMVAGCSVNAGSLGTAVRQAPACGTASGAMLGGWGPGPAAARSRDSKGCESATHAAVNNAASHQGLLRLRSGHVGGRLRAPSETTTLGS